MADCKALDSAVVWIDMALVGCAIKRFEKLIKSKYKSALTVFVWFL